MHGVSYKFNKPYFHIKRLCVEKDVRYLLLTGGNERNFYLIFRRYKSLHIKFLCSTNVLTIFFCGKSYVVYVQKTSIFVTFWFRRATETPRVTQSLHRRKQNKRRVNSSLETNLAAFKCGRCKGSCGGSCWVKRTALVLQASENNSV